MAILAKIRKRTALLLTIIAFSLFAFVAQDLFRKGNFSNSSKYVGSVNGEDIDYQKFNEKVNNLEKSGRGTSTIQAVNQVWDQEVNIALLINEFKKIGISVGKSYIIDALKENQNIGQNKMFQNQAGVFDIAKFNEYFKANPEQIQFKEGAETDAVLNSKYQIYGALIKSGFNVTKAEAKLKYQAEANKISFDFVSLPFTSIKDSEIKISDDEIIAFMKKDKKKYKADETREIEYVLIEDKPSVEDENEIKANINALLLGSIQYNNETKKNDTIQGFKSVSNNIDFVNKYSDKPYDSTYIAKKDLPAADGEKLMNLATDEVYGPYINEKFYCLSKSMGKKSGVNVKASHILIGWEGSQAQNQKEKRTKVQAKAKADLILAQVLINPSSFVMAAFQNSEDSSAQQGGDLGYFSQGQMVKPFNDFVFNNPKGKIGLVETQFGYHIINITDKQDGIRLATVARKIEASEKTSDKLYSTATKFEKAANEKDFDVVSKQMKLTVIPKIKLKVLDDVVGSLGSQRQIVRWSFDKDTDLNDIKRFEIANLGEVIVKLNKINKAGLLSIDDAKIQVEPILKNEKKTRLIVDKMKGKSLEAIATANKTTVLQAVDLTLENANIPNAGTEYKVVGTAFGTIKNKISIPIEGKSGVYIVRTKNFTKAVTINDYTPYITKLKQQNTGKANGFIEALKKDADITDNRSNFNY